MIEADEPPSTLTQVAVVRNTQETAGFLFPKEVIKNYLSIEEYRLYPFTINTGPLLENYLQYQGIPLSDYSFANNIIWLSRKSGFYQIIEDCFCLFSLNGDRLAMLLPPLGLPENQRRALEVCFDIMDAYNPTPFLSVMEYVYRDFLPVLDIEGDTGNSTRREEWLVETSLPDYIYRTEDLIDLKGNPYKTKRSEINQFRRSYPDHRIEALGPQHWQGVRELLDRWLINRIKFMPENAVSEFLDTAEQERQAIERALEYHDRLNLLGLCLFIGDRLEGFTLGERLAPGVASVLVEKTNFAISGSAQFLFREICLLYADCEFMNVGDDLGMENLRKVKMSYRPARFGEKVTIRRSRIRG
ncbi:MAG: phosphatidylglycerol lysyltransferase domain-containing protein [Nitrospirota bacterium]|nr:phosphatidylglycerol lysyltransferase domain-containing protein [Nitrospirota bacterium]